jgi:hypothetical protein
MLKNPREVNHYQELYLCIKIPFFIIKHFTSFGLQSTFQLSSNE